MGGVKASRALLDLLVNYLAQHEEAWQLREGLRPRALRDPQVRLHLGLAAAHVGELAQLRKLVKGLDGEQVAEAWAVAGRLAVQTGDLEQAEAALYELQQLDPQHPQAVDLEDAITQARADARAPLESQARQLLENGDADGAADAARAILESWPRSQEARRILSEVERLRREARMEEQLEAAREAEEQGDLGTALARLRSLLDELPDPDLAQRVESLERRLFAERISKERRRVRQLLHRDRARGLMAWMELELALRGAVAADLDEPLLEPLAGVAGRVRPAQREEAVGALMRLPALEDRQRAGDAQGALGILAWGAPWLGMIEEGRRVERWAKATALQERRECTHAAWSQAQRRWEEGDAERTLERLAETDASLLPPRQAQDARSLKVRALARVDRDRNQRVIQQLADEGKLIAARDRAGQLADQTDAPYWGRRYAELAAAVSQSFCLRILDGDAGWADMRDHMPVIRNLPEICLDAEGERAVLADSYGRLLVLRIVDLATGKPERIVRLRTPRPMRLPVVHLERTGAWVWGERYMLQFDPRSWEVRRWDDLRERLAPGEEPRDVALAGGGRYLWLNLKDSGGSGSLVLDAHSMRLLHRDALPQRVFPLLGAGHAWVGFLDAAGGHVGRRAARGKGPWSRMPLPRPVAGTAMPDGEGLVGFGGIPSQDEEERPRMGVAMAPGDTEDVNMVSPGGLSGEEWGQLAVSGEWGMSYLLARHQKGAPMIWALQNSPFGVREVWCSLVPRTARLLSSADGRWAAALSYTTRGVRIVELHDLAPDYALGDEFAAWPELELTDPLIWSEQARAACEPLAPCLEHLEAEDEHPERGWRRAFKAAGDEPVACTRLVLLAWHRGEGGQQQLDQGVDMLLERWPDHAAVVLGVAVRHASRRQWRRAARLAELPFERLPEDLRVPARFLLGLARLQAGDAEGALAAWRAIPTEHAPLEQLDYVEELLQVGDGAARDARCPMVAEMLRGMHRAERALDAGDHGSAREILQEPWAWLDMDVQLCARKAAAAMEAPIESERDLHRSTVMVGSWLNVLDQQGERARIPLGRLAWDEERLRALERRAWAWLDEVLAREDLALGE